MTNDTAGAGEPIATTVVSWVMAVLAAAGLLFAYSMKGRYPGMQNLEVAVVGILGLVGGFFASALGTLIGGIGLLLARRKRITFRPLTAAFAVNALLFLMFVITWAMISSASPSSQP